MFPSLQKVLLDGTDLGWETLLLCRRHLSCLYIMLNFYNWQNMKYTLKGKDTLALKFLSSKADVNYCLTGVCHKK